MATKPVILDSKKRILIGAIGGISPIIISLLVVDVISLYKETGLIDGIGLGIRFLVLIFIGGLVGYLHQNEQEPFKLFQLGIAAPALLTTAINGNSITNQSQLHEYRSQTDITFFIKSAYADQHAYTNSNLFLEPKVSDTQLFLRGLLGTKLFNEEDDWFVIIGSHKNIQRAKAQVTVAAEKKYKAKIYSPSDQSEYYSVVIGANLDLKSAQRLQHEAVKHGLPKDTYLWKRK